MKKNIFINCLIALIFGSCTQDKESKARLEELQTRTNIETQNKAIVQKSIEALNNRDTLMYKQLYATNCMLYFPSASTKPESVSEDLQSTKKTWIALPDIHWKIEEMVAEGDMVVARYTVTGTQKEDWWGIPASGKKIETCGIFIVRIVNGKIIELREDGDVLGIFQQLGMELKPANEKK